MIKREYYYTIEEMIQIIAEYEIEKQIIAEYKVTEGIETITEEELLNLLGDNFLYSNLYWIGPHYYSGCEHLYISDYDQYQIDNGYDPITADFLDELNRIDYQFIPTVDTVQLYDVENEDWSKFSCTWEELVDAAYVDEGLWCWLGIPIL